MAEPGTYCYSNDLVKSGCMLVGQFIAQREILFTSSHQNRCGDQGLYSGKPMRHHEEGCGAGWRKGRPEDHATREPHARIESAPAKKNPQTARTFAEF
jgi:hypothetical protein